MLAGSRKEGSPVKGGTNNPGRRPKAELSDDGSLPVCHERPHTRQYRLQHHRRLSPHKHFTEHVLRAKCLQQANPKQGLP